MRKILIGTPFSHSQNLHYCLVCSVYFHDQTDLVIIIFGAHHEGFKRPSPRGLQEKEILGIEGRIIGRLGKNLLRHLILDFQEIPSIQILASTNYLQSCPTH